jgi:glycosyltransferase involved in cell wall biosynthesis
MISRKKKILFFTPYATRTGSEMMLLYVIKNIDRTRFDIGIASFANGELLKEFPEDVPVFIIPRNFNTLEKISFHLGVNPINRTLRKLAKNFGADLWYVNTMMLPETVTVAKEFSIKIFTHFHELPLTYAYMDRADMENIITGSDLLIGCSQVTCNAISDAGGKNLALLYEFIDNEQINTDADRITTLRQELNIGKDDFVWVLSGMTSERKGFDMLPDIAEAIDDARVHLIWIGAKIHDGLVYYTEQRCINSKSRTHIHLVGKQKEDYYNYLDLGQGFLLTSRQDPFPLVMIEAAFLGKPIISFPSGGVSEFVQDGMGLITEDISVKQMVAIMQRVMRGQLSLDSEKSRQVAAQFNIKNGYQKWLDIINRYA